MKTLFLAAGIAVLSFTSAGAAVSKTANDNATVITHADWMKSTAGTWTGMSDNMKVWYKLNSADASLWWSADGMKWDAVKSGMWQDKPGKWLKINDKKLVWSADGGKTWVEVPEWSWEDADGNWQKFDKDWTLWTKTMMHESEWMSSSGGTWTGNSEGKKVWYKLDVKDASLWWSADGKKWEAVKNGIWQDKSGKWLKIADKKLVWSADGGKTWSEVPEWTWEDADGNWQKFDSSWMLWTKKEM